MNEWIGFWCCTLESALAEIECYISLEFNRNTWILLISYSRVHYIFFHCKYDSVKFKVVYF